MSKRVCTMGVMAIAVCLAATAHAQYPFGKNKVIYQGKDWRVLETPHVDIYHYAPDSTLILYLAPLVEETFLEFSQTFRLEFRRRLPFVFYATHYDFQQTNILPVLISEYTGGFTDLMKGRIAVPFNGSYANLRHVVRHEMVHAFMLEKLQVHMHDMGKYSFSHPPLWFVEGMAEYFANTPQNAQGEMFVRDALLNGRLYDLDEIWRIEGSYMMYKQGEAVINYIATNFGSDAVIRILEAWWTAPDFTLVLANTIGMDLYEVNDAFTKYMKRKYYPAVLTRQFATDEGVQRTPPRSFHSRPAAAFAGAFPTPHDSTMKEKIVYSLTGRDGVVVLTRGRGSQRVTSATPGAAGVEGIADMPWHEDVIVSGGRSRDLESMPAFRSKIEAIGDTLIFVSKSSARDRVYFWSAREHEEIAHFEFEGLSIIQSPTISGDRTKMVFGAIDTRGVLDLYLVHLAGRRLERLTEDGFSEEDPDFHPYDDVILFASDRGAGQSKDRTHIYRMDLETREITALEGGDFGDANPDWAPDGRSFLFASDRDGASNIYLREGDAVFRQTNVLTGVSAPSFYPDGSGFVAVVYEAGEFHLYDFAVRRAATAVPAHARPPDDLVVPWSRADMADSSFVTKPYETRFSIDFIGAGVAIDPEAGDIGNGGQLVMTDVLGNHQISFVFGTTTEDFNNFWEDFNAAVAYLNLSHRVNYSMSLFHLNTYSDLRLLSQREKRVGGAFGVSYPLDKFQRVEGSLILRQIEISDLEAQIRDSDKKSFTGSLFGSYVRDNSVWTIGGPLTGWRYYVTAGQTVDFQGRDFDNTILQLDVRRYLKVSSRVVFAARYLNRSAWGGDEQVFYLGGPWTLRGYPYNEFFGRTIQLFNTELRFPLLDGLRIVLPFGPIEFPMFRGALFFDAGMTDRNEFEILDTEWLGSVGTGIELNLGYAPVMRVNFTWPTDFDTLSGDTGFELFIGYNY